MKELNESLNYKEARIHRRTDCVNYIDCVSFVIDRNFISFSCENCNLPEEEYGRTN